MKDKKRSKPARSEPQSSKLRAQSSRQRPALNPQPSTLKAASSPVPIVGVGASAGGLEAFTRLLKQMPPDTGLGFVLVQHLDPQHDSALVQLLGRTTSMPVREVTQDLRVEADHVYIIPPNTNLGIAQGRLKLQPRQQTGRAQRVIDGFFESLAQDQRERAIGVPCDEKLQRLCGAALPGQLIFLLNGQLGVPGGRRGVRGSLLAIACVCGL